MSYVGSRKAKAFRRTGARARTSVRTGSSMCESWRRSRKVPMPDEDREVRRDRGAAEAEAALGDRDTVAMASEGDDRAGSSIGSDPAMVDTLHRGATHWSMTSE